MTNEQLYLLLMAMLDDLHNATAEAYGLMPEDAERDHQEVKKLKDEYQGDPRFSALLSPDAWETVLTPGDFRALSPFTSLAEKWENRIKMLLSSGGD